MTAREARFLAWGSFGLSALLCGRSVGMIPIVLNALLPRLTIPL